jgi:hypothetical protein
VVGCSFLLGSLHEWLVKTNPSRLIPSFSWICSRCTYSQ